MHEFVSIESIRSKVVEFTITRILLALKGGERSLLRFQFSNFASSPERNDHWRPFRFSPFFLSLDSQDWSDEGIHSAHESYRSRGLGGLILTAHLSFLVAPFLRPCIRMSLFRADDRWSMIIRYVYDLHGRVSAPAYVSTTWTR